MIKGVKMKKFMLFVVILLAIAGCAGNRTETTVNITGSDNTITCSQVPTTHKTSETDTKVSGSGYGDVGK